MLTKNSIIFKQFFRCYVGLSGAIPDNSLIGGYSNSYAMPIIGHHHHCYGCLLAGERHRFELPEGAIQPEMKQFGNVFGCGLVLDPDNNLAIFFTLNGKLLGELMLEVWKNMSCIFAIISFFNQP
jgi:hypothetical protein